MKIQKCLLLALGSLIAAPVVMHATLLNVDFSYGSGSTAVSGDFSLDATLIAPGEYLATAGSLTLTGNGVAADGLLTNTAYPLIPNPDPPGGSFSPTGYFIFDDLSELGNPPVVTNDGLLAGSGGTEINLFSNGTDNYQFYVNNGDNQTFVVPTTGSISVSVPDGGMTLTLLGVALAGLAFFRRKAITCLIA